MGEGVRPLSQNPFGFLSLTYGREKEDKPKIWDFGFWDSLFGFREGSNIKWADARDLASYARGKLGIVPGDKIAEKERHQSLLQAALEANAQCPKKKRPAAPKEPELSYEERIRKEKIEKSAKKMARGGYRRVYY